LIVILIFGCLTCWQRPADNLQEEAATQQKKFKPTPITWP